MIKLINGSIFDSKCDLIVIPCNSLGGITTKIANSLQDNNLPYWGRKMEPGEVYFQNTNREFANASVIAYAASVDAKDDSTSEDIVDSIISKVKRYCIDNTLRNVNIPLLGTGAGGMDSNKSYNIIKSAFENEKSLQANVFIWSGKLYDLLISREKRTEKAKVRPPRVFISYTGIDNENRIWVKDFACRLRENGVDARIDLFHLHPGHDLPQWMTNELIMADKVLMICDKYYAAKADLKKGGVGWETMIIQGDMLANAESSKYICIIVDKDIDRSLPLFAKSKFALVWTDHKASQEDFNNLLYTLYDCNIEPPIGEIPEFIVKKISEA